MLVVTFTDDQKVKLLKDCSDLFFAAKQLHDWVKENRLSEEMAGTLPSLIESHFVSVSKALNYGSRLEKEQEERHAAIRTANVRIRVLEDQLASNRSIDGLGEQLKRLGDIIKEWWREEGFRHVSEMKFTQYGGLEIEFSFMLDTHMDVLFNELPVTSMKKKVNKIQQLIERGFELEKENENSRSWDVLDTPKNRQLLIEMLEKRFPSISITKIGSWAKGVHKNNEKFTMWHLEAYIHDLHDIPAKEDTK